MVHVVGFFFFFFMQGMKNNVRFTFSVDDTTWAIYNLGIEQDK